MRYFILVICLVLASSLGVSAYAMTSIQAGKLVTGSVLGNPNIIAVQLSNTCLALVKHNQTDECPSYYQIRNVDNSNVISGKFVFTNGFYHRMIPKTEFSFQMYKTGQNVIILDPDFNTIMYKNTQLIIFVPSLNYKINSDLANNTDRFQYVGRFVDNACKTATIVYSPSLFNDTIAYLRAGCVVSATHFISKQDIKRGEVKLNYNTASSINQKWYQQAKQQTQNCITNPKCIPLKDPHSRF